MAQIRIAQKVDPSTLTDQQRATLANQLYRVHEEVFRGLDREGFDHYVVSSSAEATRIFLYRDKQGKLVGYFGTHRFRKILGGHSIVVFRAEVGLLPGHRQRDAFTAPWLIEAAKYKLSHPTEPVYFFYAPVSPSFYAMVARYTYRLYPKHDRRVPERLQELLLHLAQEFALEQADERNVLVRKVGWSTKALTHERLFWQQSSNPHVRFYVKTNPRFPEGTGLLTIIPITFPNLIVSLIGSAFFTFRKRLRNSRLLAWTTRSNYGGLDRTDR